MSRPLDPGAVKRHIHKVNVPPATNRKAENALACFFIVAVIAAGCLL